MMALLFAGQVLVGPRFPDNPLFGMAASGNPLGGLGFALVAGLLGAWLINKYATTEPPPPPSKTQQRKMARTKAPTEDEEEPEPVPARGSSAARRRRRRR